MNADTDVMAHFPATLNRADSDALATRISEALVERGWGLWALEEQTSGKFLGFTGLSPFSELPIPDGVEIGWRLTRASWGKGFATEAAHRALQFAFEELRLDRVDSFTATTNLRSIAVMERLGMRRSAETFLHPRVPADSPLCEHVLYQLDRNQWSAM